MFDLQLPNSLPASSPRVKEFVQRILPQLSGLQELAREKEVAAGAAIQHEDETNDCSEAESDGRKEAIKRLKTSRDYFSLWKKELVC